MGFDLPDDYNDVPARIAAFREKYPEGTLRQKSLEFVTVPTTHDLVNKNQRAKGVELTPKLMVVYTAQAYRTPDDPAPGEGTAAEFFPGKTPYTFDSEVQNAETAAWGRALIAVGAADAKRISSNEEIKNRSANFDTSEPEPDPVYEAHLRIARAAKALGLGKADVLKDWESSYDTDFDRATRDDLDRLNEFAVAYELRAQ